MRYIVNSNAHERCLSVCLSCSPHLDQGGELRRLLLPVCTIYHSNRPGSSSTTTTTTTNFVLSTM